MKTALQKLDAIYTIGDAHWLRTQYSQLPQDVIRNRLNNMLGFNLEYSEYMAFLRACNGVSDTLTDSALVVMTLNRLPIYNSSKSLCNRSATAFDASITMKDCAEDVAVASQLNLDLTYAQYLSSVKDIFRQQFIQKCMRAMNTEVLTMEHAVRQFHYTLYYYDQNGHLLQTVPPAGVKLLSNAAIAQVQGYRNGTRSTPVYNAHTMATYYRYNTLDELVWQKTPDAGISEFYYDRLGRIVLSQNAKQQPLHQYSYTQYDDQGRMVEVGQLTAPNEVGVTGVVLKYMDMDAFTAFDTTNLSGWFFEALPSATHIVKTFYDANPYVAPGHQIPFTGGTPKHLRKNIAATATYASRNTACLPAHVTHYTYDYVNNVYEIIQEDSLLASCLSDHRYKKTEYGYDLISNKVNEVVYQRGRTDQYIHQYRYDSDNRLTEVYSGPSWYRLDKEASYDYYQHGPVGRVEIGQRNLQGIDYAYTMMGWIKALNSEYLSPEQDMGKDGFGDMYTQSLFDVNFQTGAPMGLFGSFIGNMESNAFRTDEANHSNFARDAFGYTLHYFQDDYTPTGNMTGAFQYPYADIAGLQSNQTNLYNGNISFSSVSIPSGTQPQYFPAPQLAKYRYDQLNRITSAVYTSDLNPSTLMWGGNFDNNWASKYSYDPNGNIKTLIRNQTADHGFAMDNLEYHYISGTNQLEYVADGVPTSASDNDIDPQTQGNYSYDLIGNLTKDDAEGISAITWLPNNKIGTITKTNGMVIQFTYDASGQRITKKVEKIVQGVRITEIEFYLRDASGNVMANYILHPDSCTLLLKEQPIYGSSRLGVYAPNKDVTSNTVPSIGAQNAQKFAQIRGQRLYELSNWLGNVQVVITDKKLAICGSAQTPAYYEADIQSAQDYYPFGSLMPERNFNSAGYKYGMNGQEKTDEIAGAGNHTTAEFWEYDTRLGRRWNVDPITYPWQSSYAVNNNNPIVFTDPFGLFGSRKEAREYKEEHDLKGRIIKGSDDLFYIRNKKGGTSYFRDHSLDDVPNLSGRQDDGVIKSVFISAQSGGGVLNDISNLTQQYTSPSADLFIGATESKIGQILLDRSKYGSLHPETIIRTPVANISLSTKLLQNTGTALKWGGRAFGAVGLVGTYAQWQTGAIGNTEAALDATFGAIGFLPGYGWAVSGAYFLIAKPLYNYSTKP